LFKDLIKVAINQRLQLSGILHITHFNTFSKQMFRLDLYVSKMIVLIKDDIKCSVLSYNKFLKHNKDNSLLSPNAVRNFVFLIQKKFTALIKLCRMYSLNRVAEAMQNFGNQFRQIR
jgi:hypothetical protein